MDYREFIQLDLPVAVAIVSCGADWRVEEANAEFTDVLGYTEKELRETRPQKMVYDEDYANLVSVLENVVRTHDNGKMQLRIVRPDGKTRWVEMRCSVLAHYDVKPYVVLFLWDIDEEKRREEHQKLLNQKYELMEQLSLEYPFDLDVENWTMLRSYRLMELSVWHILCNRAAFGKAEFNVGGSFVLLSFYYSTGCAPVSPSIFHPGF